MIQCAVFKGTTRAVFLDRRNYEGPLWKQVEEAVQFVLRNIRMGCRLEGVYRQDIYELPPDSIRELIVNAVMNCSYIQNSNIQVAIYDDRLEITSPGGLLPGVTIELMKEGFSKIRNRSLANAFAYMNLVEAWGSGIPKLMQAMQEYGLREPEFIDMEVAFRINLYRGQNEVIEVKNRDHDLNHGSNDLNREPDDLNHEPVDLDRDPNDPNHDPKDDLEIQLSEMIYKNPELTQKELAKALAVSTATIKRMLTKTGFCVYNTHSLLKLRHAVGPEIGANFDPSHLIWQGMDPVACIRELGKENAIFHFHAKDTRVDKYNTAVNGVLDTRPYADEIHRSWIFRSCGYGNDTLYWKDMISALRMVGYDYAISIEHEDSLMSQNEGLSKAVEFLKGVLTFEDKMSNMWWA